MGVVVTFTYTWTPDPFLPGNGSFNCRFDWAAGGYDSAGDEINEPDVTEWAFDAFKIGTGAASSSALGRNAEVWIDDVTYMVGDRLETFALFFENSDNVTHLLVRGYTGPEVLNVADQEGDLGIDIDGDDDGVPDLDPLPWTEVVDAVGIVEEPEGVEKLFGVTFGGVDLDPNGPFAPAHVFRDGVSGDWLIGTFDFNDPNANDTPGAENPSLLIFLESFETDGSVATGDGRYTVENQSDDGASDYFNRRAVGSAGTRVRGGAVDGDFYWGARDLNGDGVPVNDLEDEEARITWNNPIDIAGRGNLELTVAAAQGDDEQEFDNPLVFQYKIDDGPWLTAGGFRGLHSNSPSYVFEGGHFGVSSGVVPESTDPRLTRTFRDWEFRIFGTGSTMQFRVFVNANGGLEEYGFDNIRISGDNSLTFFTLSLNSAGFLETDGGGAGVLTITALGGAPGSDVVFALEESDTDNSEAALPAEITLPAGQSTVGVPFDILADGRFDGDEPVTIQVSAPGWAREQITFTVTNVDPKPNVVVNEFYPDPFNFFAPTDLQGDSNNDGVRNDDEDEFMEIVNLEAFPVDISSWELWDERGPRHIFPDGTVLGAGQAAVVFGGGDPHGIFGGSKVDTSSQGNFSFGVTGENVSLRAGGANAAGAFVDNFTYPPELGGTMHSITRNPDGTGGFVDHATVAPGGAFFSPGTKSDGTPFFTFADTLSIAFDSGTVAEDATDIGGTVSLTNPAPAGGLLVSLLAEGDNADELILPATVTIPEGATEIGFTAQPVNDGVLDGDREVTIRATADNMFPALAYLTTTEVEPNPFNVVINETLGSILGSSLDANGNGIFEEPVEDQFIEIVNNGDFNVDLTGWTVRVARTDEPDPELLVHTFPSGTLLAPQGAIVIFGGGEEAALQAASDALFGGALVQVANSSFNGVNLTDNGDGRISLLTPNGFVEDRVEYPMENSDQAQSLVRSPDLSGDFGTLHFEVSTAFELASPGRRLDGIPFGQGNATFTVTITNDSGAGSLRQAILDANSNPGSDLISFDPALQGGRISLNGTPLPEITDALTIIGLPKPPDSRFPIELPTVPQPPLGFQASALEPASRTPPEVNRLTVDGDNQSRILQIGAGVTVEIRNLTVSGGVHFEEFPENRAGAVLNLGNLTIRDCSIEENASPFGGGIFNDGFTTIVNSSIVANGAAVSGGAIYNFGGIVEILDSDVSGNFADSGDGGGIYNDGGDLMVTNSTFSGNFVEIDGGDGGGIYNRGGDLAVTDSIVENSAAEDGGGVFNSSGGNFSISGSSFLGNFADFFGGGLYNDDGTGDVIETTFAANVTVESGGGIYNLELGFIKVFNSTLSGNEAGVHGGAVRNFEGSLFFGNSTITENRSDTDEDGSGEGGGIATNRDTVCLYNSIVARNFKGLGETFSDIDGLLDESGSFFNLIGDATTAGGLLDGVDNNMVGFDPVLGLLQDNGGPTLTHALLEGSSAIDAGSNAQAVDFGGSPLLTDQRGAGFERIYDTGSGIATVDIGAFELNAQLFSTWAEGQFGGGGLGAGPSDDPDQDGMDNFFEFLFDLDPVSGNTGGNLPQILVDSGDLQVAFTRRQDVSGVIWQYEISEDLLFWYTGVEGIDYLEMAVSNNGDGSETVTIELIGDPEEIENLFVRVSASTLLPLPAAVASSANPNARISIGSGNDERGRDDESATSTDSELFHQAGRQSGNLGVTIQNEDFGSLADTLNALGGADNPVPGFANWFFSKWYGFYNTTYAPWFFHFQHGWQYIYTYKVEDIGEVLIYDLESDSIWWTSSEFVPLTFYDFSRTTWSLYFSDTSNPRQFVDLETGEFWTVPVEVTCPCFSVGDIIQVFSDIRELADGAVTETCSLGITGGLPGTDLDQVRTEAEPVLDDTFAFASAGPICISQLNGICTNLEKKCRISKFVFDVPDPFIDVRSLTDEEIAVCKADIRSAAEEMNIQCN